MSVLSERTHNESKESDGFRDQLQTRIGDFVVLILTPKFGPLMNFVKSAEITVEKNESEKLIREEGDVLKIIQNFNRDWKASLDEINNDVLSIFPNFKNGTNILQQILTTFVQYYHRFHKILSLAVFANSQCKKQLMNVHQLMVEVKKFKPTF